MKAIDLTPRSMRDVALKRCRQALVWTLCIECLSWPLRYYKFIIYSHLPPIFYEWGPLLFFIAVIATEVYALYLPIRYFKMIQIRSLYPLAIIVISHFIISHTSPSNINIMSYYSLFRKEREYIATSYCDGKLALAHGECDRCVQLPEKWKYLSLMSDHVEIECDTMRPQALFYTQWGFFSYWEALLYRFDGSYPDDPLILKSYKITRLNDHWFYIIH
ncbi:conserved hypothetical protein [Solidesulfovibrio fructosivorans JJ]]|uniref:Uncharacterized protein n=1 Tax=Solidesulfovibrio fructosivorans JJ] TaxID=596151 RepID=E1JT90_SOLFR|nr:conserved hypothetical protein [Solidesulfovibrio fructosivorans JJ]]